MHFQILMWSLETELLLLLTVDKVDVAQVTMQCGYKGHLDNYLKVNLVLLASNAIQICRKINIILQALKQHSGENSMILYLFVCLPANFEVSQNKHYFSLPAQQSSKFKLKSRYYAKCCKSMKFSAKCYFNLVLPPMDCQQCCYRRSSNSAVSNSLVSL